MTTPILGMYLNHTIASLIEAGETLMGVKFMLTSEKYRASVLEKVKDPIVKGFWKDYEKLSDKQRTDSTASTLNKISY